MGRVRSAFGIICVLLTLLAEKIQCPTVNTQPESSCCVLQTQNGVDIRVYLKPSLNKDYNLHQTLDLTNARCCFNPDENCALTEHLNVTLNNITSLLKYPIHPLWMHVNNKRIPHKGVWDELWYSFYEFGKPSLTKTVDVKITRKISSQVKETFSVHLSSDNSVSPTTRTETSAHLVTRPHHSLVQGEDRIFNEDLFLLIPEVKDNMKKDSQTRRGPRDYLVLNQSLFEFPNSDCFNEKTRFLSLVFPKHRPCVEASSVDLEKQPYDFYVTAKISEIRNRPTEFFLSSFGTLYDPATISRHRSSVIFISQQPLILRIFIPNEEASSRLRVIEFLNTVFGTISLYSRNFGSLLTDQWTLVTATSGSCYDVITQHLQLLVNFMTRQWSSAVDVLYTAAEQLRDILVSFDKLDRISLEKSIDYQWNLIWSYIDHACHKIGVLRTDGDATIRDAYGIISEYFDTLFSLHLGTFFKDQITLVLAIIHEGYDVTTQNLQLLASFLKLQWSSAVDVLYSAAEQLCDILRSFDKVDRISLEKSIDYQWNLIWSYIDHACHKIGVLRADGDVNVAAGWIAFSLLIVFPVLLVKWLVTSLRNRAGVQEMDEIIMLNDSGTFVFGPDADLLAGFMHEAFSIMCLPPRDGEDGTSTAIVGQDTVLRPYNGIPWTQSDFSLAMDITCHDDDQYTFLRLTVSDSCINYNFEGGRSTSFRDASLIDGDDFDCDVMYLTQSLPEIGSVETSRNLSLVTETAHDEHYLPPFPRSFSSPCINPLAITEEYRRNDDYDSSYDVMSATHQETRVKGPPTRQLTSVLKHPKEEPCEVDEGTDLDEAYKIYMAQNDNAPKMCRKDKDFKQARKYFLDDIDETYGAPSQPAAHLIKEKPASKEDDGTNLDEAKETNLAQKGSAVEVNQEYKLDDDVKQSLKSLISEVDKTHGNGRTPVEEEQSEAKNEGAVLDEANKIYKSHGQTKAFPEDKDFQQTRKDFLEDIDNTYGAPSQPATHLIKEEPSENDDGTDLDEAKKVCLVQNRSTLEVSQEYKLDEEVKKSLKDLIADVDKTHGNSRTPVEKTHLEEENEGTDLDGANNIYKSQKDGTRVSTENRDFQQAKKDLLEDIDETYGPPSQPATHLISEEARKIYMAQKSSVRKVSLNEKDFEQLLKDFLAEIDETYENNQTPPRKFTNFLWQCQEVMFYVLRIYMDNRFY